MSHYVIAVLAFGQEAYVVTNSAVKVLAHNVSTKTAIEELCQNAPPLSVTHTIVYSFSDYEVRRECVALLKKAGYTDIECIDLSSVRLSSSIYNLPLNCLIGEPVFVVGGFECNLPLSHISVDVIEKCEKGWKIIKRAMQPVMALASHPSSKNVVYFKDASKEDKESLQKLFPGKRLIPSMMKQPAFNIKFFRNRVLGTDLDGYEVLPHCNIDLVLLFGQRNEFVTLSKQPAPFTYTDTINVGNSSEVRVYPCFFGNFPSELVNNQVIKTFVFKQPGYRTVSIKVDVGKDLLPEIFLKTIEKRATDFLDSEVIFTLVQTEGVFAVDICYPTHRHHDGLIQDFPTVMAYMSAAILTHSPPAVFLLYTELYHPDKFNTLRKVCLDARCKNLHVISAIILSVDVNLDMISFWDRNDDQIVAICTSTYFFVLERVNGALTMLDSGPVRKLNIDKFNVSTVVIYDVYNYYTEMDVKHFHERYHPRKVFVHSKLAVSNGSAKRFWSISKDPNWMKKSCINMSDFDLIVESGGKTQTIPMRFKMLPHTVTVDVGIDDKKFDVFIKHQTMPQYLIASKTIPNGTTIAKTTFTVNSICDVKIRIDETSTKKISAIEKDKILAETETKEKAKTESTVEKPMKDVKVAVEPKPELTKTQKKKDRLAKKLEAAEAEARNRKAELEKTQKTTNSSEIEVMPLPSTILSFTKDNRIIIETDDKTYSGDRDVPAYVRLQRFGRAPEIGESAYRAMKKDPESVIYDIVRLLAVDFELENADPSWHFSVSRNATGQIVIHAGVDVVTYPIVVFGLVIKSTLIYIQENVETKIESLGIRSPTKLDVTDEKLKDLSKRIGVELIML